MGTSLSLQRVFAWGSSLLLAGAVLLMPVGSAFAISGQPDLAVDSIINVNGMLSIKVGNEGTRDVFSSEEEGARLHIYVNEVLRRNYLLSQLNDDLQEAGNATVLTPFAFGTQYLSNNQDHVVEVCVDPTHVVEDSDSTNNCKTVTLRNNVEVPVPAQADLTVHGIVNRNGTLAIKVGNQGDRDVTDEEASHSNLTIYTNGTLRRTYQLMRLNPDLRSAGNATVLTPFVFGTSYLPNNQNNRVKVCVDATNVVSEENELNNCKEVVLRNNVEVPVPAQPDLAVTNISKHGSSVRIKVQNLSGEAVVMESGKVYKFDVYVDGNLIYGYNWSTLANQNFMDAWGTSVFSPLNMSSASLSSGGYHVVRACIDTVNVVEESRESNNCFKTKIYSPVVEEDEVEIEVFEDDPTPTVISVPTPPAGFEDEVLVATVNSPNPFSDTAMTSREGRAAATLYNNAIIGGYPNGTFGGNRAVNRAEAAKFLLLAQYGELGNFTNNGRFNDVLDGQWYVRFVVRAAQLGIIEGYSDGGFRPGAQVNTAEFLKMMTLTFDLPTHLDHDFSDVAAGTWYASYAGIASEYNLFPNRGNMLRPGALLTRNEVAVAIYQYLVNR